MLSKKFDSQMKFKKGRRGRAWGWMGVILLLSVY